MPERHNRAALFDEPDQFAGYNSIRSTATLKGFAHHLGQPD
jgi:hypothetical protein